MREIETLGRASPMIVIAGFVSLRSLILLAIITIRWEVHQSDRSCMRDGWMIVYSVP